MNVHTHGRSPACIPLLHEEREIRKKRIAMETLICEAVYSYSLLLRCVCVRVITVCVIIITAQQPPWTPLSHSLTLAAGRDLWPWPLYETGQTPLCRGLSSRCVSALLLLLLRFFPSLSSRWFHQSSPPHLTKPSSSSSALLALGFTLSVLHSSPSFSPFSFISPFFNRVSPGEIKNLFFTGWPGQDGQQHQKQRKKQVKRN